MPEHRWYQNRNVTPTPPRFPQQPPQHPGSPPRRLSYRDESALFTGVVVLTIIFILVVISLSLKAFPGALS